MSDSACNSSYGTLVCLVP